MAHELEDRHGDHWTVNAAEVWTRVEPPYERRSWRALQRDYGPLTAGHTAECIRVKMRGDTP